MIVGKTLLFTFVKDVTFQRNFTYSAGGLPVNLSTIEIEFHLRKHGETTEWFNLDSGEGPNANGSEVAIISAPAGTFSLKLTDEETALLDHNQGNWWITRNENGDKIKIGSGKYSVELP